MQFTQLCLPDGRKKKIECTRPPDVEIKAKLFEINGMRFTAEILRTKEVSFTISDGENDIAIEVCANDDEVLLAIDRLIRNTPVPGVSA